MKEDIYLKGIKDLAKKYKKWINIKSDIKYIFYRVRIHTDINSIQGISSIRAVIIFKDNSESSCFTRIIIKYIIKVVAHNSLTLSNRYVDSITVFMQNPNEIFNFIANLKTTDQCRWRGLLS